MSRLRTVALCTAICAASCGSFAFGDATWTVAVAGHGAIPAWNGACDVQRARSGGAVILSDGSWRAVHAGRAQIPCAQGAVVLDVHDVARLSVQCTVAVKSGGGCELHAFDARGDDLVLGDDADVTWSFGPGLVEGSRCDHMLGFCRASWQAQVLADAPVTSWAQAAFGGRTARVAVEAR